jgi:hypothetical protein
MRKGILFTLLEKQAEDPDYWRNVNGNNIGFDGKVGTGKMVAGNPKAMGADGDASGATAKRSGQSFAGQSANSAKFANQKLADSDFSGVDYESASFGGSDLKGSSFERARIVSAQMRKAELDDVDFGGALMDGDLSDSSIKGANFQGMYSNRLDVGDSDLSGADLRFTDIQKLRVTAKTNFTGTKVHKSFLRDHGDDLTDEQKKQFAVEDDPTIQQELAVKRKYKRDSVESANMRRARVDAHTQDIVEWGDATHYMKVKNPKTGNMNKIGFNDAGRAVSGDADLMKSINSKRRVKGADERDTIKALAPHNKQAERGGAPTSTNAYAISTKELGKAWKKRSKNWQQGTASDNAGFSWGTDNTPQENRARDISIAADKAVDSLIDKKRKIKQLHGKKYRNPSMLDRLGRKLQSFLKPETLSDKDI